MGTLLDFAKERPTPAEEYAAWIRENAHVYELFKKFALELRGKGFARYSARSILYRIRWHVDVETNPVPGGDEFKINDHYSPYLARQLIAEDPTFNTFFEFRKVQS